MNPLISCLKSVLRKTGLLPKFHHTLNKINPTFESLHPANLHAISNALRHAPKGDYYEFGVYKGFSFWFATQIADALGKNEMRFFGFDSFDGLPEPTGVDKEPDAAGNVFARGCFCAGQQFVENFLALYGTDMSKVRLIPGFFENVLSPSILNEHKMGPASVILIDCDMFESTRTVLDFLPNLLQEGSIILFDDWLLTDETKGQRLAFDGWIKKNAGLVLEEFCTFSGGKGFRVVKTGK